MMKSLIHVCLLLVASFCAVLFASCYTPLFTDPLDDKDLPEDMFDAEIYESLLKIGSMKEKDGAFVIEFSKEKYPELISYTDKTANLVRYTLFGLVTFFYPDGPKEDVWETTLPVMIVPFRYADKLFFRMTIDYLYFLAEKDIDFNFLFMMHPYSFILSAEENEDDGWDVGFVEFASVDFTFDLNDLLKTKKHSELVKLHQNVVINSKEEIFEMLKDPKNYEIRTKYSLQSVPDGRLEELKASLRAEAEEKNRKSRKKTETETAPADDSQQEKSK